MPFTFSHIGYVLPIHKSWKKYFSISGLVFGSLTPDFDILFRLTNVRFHIFQYDLTSVLFLIYPLSLISAITFHLIARNIIIDHLPLFLASKYQNLKQFNFVNYLRKNFFKVSYSIIFAVYFHLLLDFFCHFLDANSVSIFVAKFTDNTTLVSISYHLAIYLLPILFSLVGFYLIYKSAKTNLLTLQALEISNSSKLFWIIILFNTMLFTIFKFYITQTDNVFIIDYFIINITPSIMVAIYFTCFLYLVNSKLKTV